jgi:hypothetical protein
MVIRRLLARHDGRIPVGVLVRIWREIISACTALQEKLAVAVYEDEQISSFERLARAHFGSMTALMRYSSISGVMHAITERRATVGLLPLGTSERDVPWWLFLARRAGHRAAAVRAAAGPPARPSGGACVGARAAGGKR